MIGKLNHVAIVVPDLAEASALYRDGFGADVSEPVDLPAQGVTTVFVNLPNTKIELLHPLGEGSPVEKFLGNNPKGGMHHVCYEVTDLEAAIAKLTADGMTVLGDGKPSIGAHGLPVVFLHPKDALGTLVELEEVA
jgi:methylmalonyl-CoA/ethylmalonyl-CoA epimerase